MFYILCFKSYISKYKSKAYVRDCDAKPNNDILYISAIYYNYKVPKYTMYLESVVNPKYLNDNKYVIYSIQYGYYNDNIVYSRNVRTYHYSCCISDDQTHEWIMYRDIIYQVFVQGYYTNFDLYGNVISDTLNQYDIGSNKIRDYDFLYKYIYANTNIKPI